MDGVLPPPHLNGKDNGYIGFVLHTKAKDTDRYDGPCIESGYVRGLFHRSLKKNFREGELIVEDIMGAKHTFMIVAYHQYPIPEGLYALVGSSPWYPWGPFSERQCWVVGERLQERCLRKCRCSKSPTRRT